MTSKVDDTPRVWIGSLAAYNDGRLIGKWVDADDLETLEAAAADVLKRGGGEEIALMDFEGFGNLIGEYTQLDRVAELGEAISEHGDAFVSYWIWSSLAEDEDVTDAVEQFEEAYCGQWDSMRDYAENLAEDLGAINHDAGWPMNCIDWEQATRELEMDYFITQAGYVFRSI